MMNYFKVLLWGVTCLSCASASYAETLPEAVAVALANHPATQGAEARYEAAKQQRKAATSGYFPELSVSTTAGRVYADNSTSRGLSVTRGAGYSGLWEGSVTARQMIFDGMSTQSQVQAAKASEKSAELSITDVQEGLALRTVQTYLNLMRAKAGLDMLTTQEENVQNYLSRIQTMLNDGASDEAELQQARDVLQILENYKTDYAGQAKTLESDYLELTGRLPESALSVPVFPADAIPKTIEEAIALAKKSHPMLQAAGFDAQAAQQNVRAEKATLYPDVNAELSYDKTDKRDLIGGESTDEKAVVRMSWNLETGGGQLARIREKTFEQKAAQSHEQELARSVERGVRQAYAEHQTAWDQLKIQEQRVDLNNKLLEAYKTQFEGTKITLLQLMQADNQSLITKLEKMNAGNRVVLAQYGILAAMGRLQDSLKAPAPAPVRISEGAVPSQAPTKAK